MRDWVLFGHVLFAIIWMGGSVYVEALAANAKRRNDPLALGVLFRSTAALNQRLFTISGTLVVVFGFWLVFITAWEWSDPWVAISIILVGAAVVLDLFYSSPRIRGALELIEELGPANADARVLIDEVVNAGHIRLGILVIVLFLMIFK